jgi:hypothetical protein
MLFKINLYLFISGFLPRQAKNCWQHGTCNEAERITTQIKVIKSRYEQYYVLE